MYKTLHEHSYQETTVHSISLFSQTLLLLKNLLLLKLTLKIIIIHQLLSSRSQNAIFYETNSKLFSSKIYNCKSSIYTKQSNVGSVLVLHRCTNWYPLPVPTTSA